MYKDRFSNITIVIIKKNDFVNMICLDYGGFSSDRKKIFSL